MAIMFRSLIRFFLIPAIFLTTTSLVFAGDTVTSIRCDEFTFDATSSHDPDNENITYFWDFGDGNSSTEAVVDHKYTKSGVYNVTLSIADNTGLQCSTAQTIQQVRANIPPNVVLTGIGFRGFVKFDTDKIDTAIARKF